LANLSLSLEIVLFTFVIVKPSINMKKTIHLVGALVAVGLQACKSVQQKNIDLTVKPGAIWQDTNQEVINAHGGGLLKRGKNYYWYGEIRGKSASEGVSVYSSKDLVHWENKGSLWLNPKIRPVRSP
jgi:hypothetical protein